MGLPLLVFSLCLPGEAGTLYTLARKKAMNRMNLPRFYVFLSLDAHPVSGERQRGVLTSRNNQKNACMNVALTKNVILGQ